MKMKLIYTRNGDYLFPNLTIKNQSTNGINKYGYLRLRYLKENKKALYTTLLMTNELTNHLISVSKNSEARSRCCTCRIAMPSPLPRRCALCRCLVRR